MDTNNVKIVRELLGLSQAKFATAIGVSQGNVNHYEHHRQDVPPRVARRVIAVAQTHGLHVTFDDIYAVGSVAAAADQHAAQSMAASLP